MSAVSDRSTVAVQNSGGATAVAEFDTATDRDARAIRERNIALNESGVADDATKYRGAAGYKNYIKKDREQLAAGKFSGTQGPIRASIFFRPSFRMDYQPDVCKDYKDTGYCGFGACVGARGARQPLLRVLCVRRCCLCVCVCGVCVACV